MSELYWNDSIWCPFQIEKKLWKKKGADGLIPLRKQRPSRPSDSLEELRELVFGTTEQAFSEDCRKGKGHRQSVQVSMQKLPVLSLCREAAPKEPTFSSGKHVSFYWAMCLCRETCLRLGVQGFYWMTVTKAQMRSHHKWNFRLPEGEQVFSALGSKITLSVYQTFQRRNFKMPGQPRANPTSRPSIDNCLRSAMISLFCMAPAAEIEMGPKPQKGHSEVQKLIPQNQKCPMFSYKSLFRIKPSQILPPLQNHPSFSASTFSLSCLSPETLWLLFFSFLW